MIKSNRAKVGASKEEIIRNPLLRTSPLWQYFVLQKEVI